MCERLLCCSYLLFLGLFVYFLVQPTPPPPPLPPPPPPPPPSPSPTPPLLGLSFAFSPPTHPPPPTPPPPHPFVVRIFLFSLFLFPVFVIFLFPVPYLAPPRPPQPPHSPPPARGQTLSPPRSLGLFCSWGMDRVVPVWRPWSGTKCGVWCVFFNAGVGVFLLRSFAKPTPTPPGPQSTRNHEQKQLPPQALIFFSFLV